MVTEAAQLRCINNLVYLNVSRLSKGLNVSPHEVAAAQAHSERVKENLVWLSKHLGQRVWRTLSYTWPDPSTEPQNLIGHEHAVYEYLCELGEHHNKCLREMSSDWKVEWSKATQGLSPYEIFAHLAWAGSADD